MGKRRFPNVPLVVAVAALAPVVAHARPRPHFEPTDLDLEDTGVVELDLQVGAVRGPGPWRALLPDFEIDFGVLPNLELGLDGSYAIEGPATGSFAFDHGVPDNLWPSAKVGLYDDREETGGRTWAVGVAVGPKLPVASTAHGVGFESLLLVARTIRRTQLVLNLGGFAEPAPDGSTPRPWGLEAGLDIATTLDDRGRLSVMGEIAGARFGSVDPSQLIATAGCSWAAAENVDISVSGLYGFFTGGDRYGLLLGVSPKSRLYNRACGPGPKC